MKTRKVSITSLLCVVFVLAGFARAEAPYATVWIGQLGTTSGDSAPGVSADGLGNVYISGETAGDLDGPNAGGWDAFTSGFDAGGNVLWTRQLGTSRDDRSYGVSADGLGSVYISGVTYGDLAEPNVGDADAFVSKYDDGGDLLWTRQFGTSEVDYSRAVSADGLDNIYIGGYTSGNLHGTNEGFKDVFVGKYDDAGDLLWTRQLGTPDYDYGYGISADGLGNVYVTGETCGNLGGPSAGGSDAFVSKYDDEGNLLWTCQLGTSSDDRSYAVSADGLGNAYISGFTEGDLGGPNEGGSDAFVSKYDDAGNLLWTRQLGTSNYDYGYGVSADGLGNVYLSGYTYGVLGGTGAGCTDAFVSKFDDDGNLLWTRQVGTAEWEYGYGASADGLGGVYISGNTSGSFGGPSAGSYDAFAIKLVCPILGDADLDGDVDDTDLALLLNGWGMVGPDWFDGNFDADNDVDDTDLAQLLNNWGSSVSVEAVPEPASAVLLLVGLPWIVQRYTGKRRTR